MAQGETREVIFICNHIATGTDEPAEMQNRLPHVILEQNYPNPCSNNTTIGFSVDHNTFVSLKVYDNIGKEVATLINRMHAAGKYKVNRETGNLSKGVYYYRLQTDDSTKTRKAILMK